MSPDAEMRAAYVLAVAGLPALLAAQESAPSLPVVRLGDAVRGALARSPELLDAQDAALLADVNVRAARAGFLPQLAPFYVTDRSGTTGERTESFGATLTEQLPTGARVEGRILLDRNGGVDPQVSRTAIGEILLVQPLLRGLDPAFAKEPLRLARRAADSRRLALEAVRRRTVVEVWRDALAVAQAERALAIAEDRIARADRLLEFSRARFTAGSVSRLDVLRAEQQQASARLVASSSRALVESARESLQRVAGLARGGAFTVDVPETLPQEIPSLEEALANAVERRPEAIDARAALRDAEAALRVARSAELPSVEGIVGWDTAGFGPSYGDAFRTGNSGLRLGLRSEVGLNRAAGTARRRSAEIALESGRRNLAILEEDLRRDVREAYRRLGTVTAEHEISAANLEVADAQATVARLRFEKGLSDNFNVVDAEGLLASARLLELQSRFDGLLARLSCLLASGTLDVARFAEAP